MNKKAKRLTSELHNRNFTKFGLDLNLVVFMLSAITLIVFSSYVFMNLDTAASTLNNFKSFIISRFDMVFVLSANFFIFALIVLAASRAGKIRIGGVEAKPEFSRFAWYAMLISAGMGIGLMFWSVGEPIYHSASSPVF